MAQFTFVQTCQISETQLGSSKIKDLLSSGARLPELDLCQEWQDGSIQQIY